jgi:hypothetical protein
MEGLPVRELFCAAVVLLACVGPLCAAPAPFDKPERAKPKPIDPRQEQATYAALIVELRQVGVMVPHAVQNDAGDWVVRYIEMHGWCGDRRRRVIKAPDKVTALGALLAHHQEKQRARDALRVVKQSAEPM